MKIAWAEWNIALELEAGKGETIQIENPLFAAEMIQDLCMQLNGDEGKIIFSKKDKDISFGKKGELIINPFSLDFENKRIQTKLLQEMKEIAIDYSNDKLAMLKSKTIEFLDDICKHLSYNISYEDEFDATAVLKMVGPRLDYSVGSSFAEVIGSYIKIMNQLCGIEIFVFVNISQFLTEEHLSSLKKDLNYLSVYIIYIETYIEHEFQKALIVDKDFCIIH